MAAERQKVVTPDSPIHTTPLSGSSSSNAKHAQQRLVDFCRRLEIYTFEPFARDTHHRACVEHVLGDAATFDSVHSSMRVLFPLEAEAPLYRNQQHILDSLTCRFPVYFGQPMLDMFEKEKLKDLFGYTLEDATQKRNPAIRYAICGRVVVQQNASAPSTPAPTTFVSHVWGVNFETRATHDYQTFVAIHDGGTLYRAKFATEMTRLADLIVRSGEYAQQHSNSTECVIVLPLIGMGAFQKQLGGADQSWALLSFVTAVSVRVGASSSANVRVELCDLESRTASNVAFKKLEHTTFHIGRGNMGGGDMFAVADKFMSTLGSKAALCVMNGWDSSSYIGNALANDPTIDGMLVAGARSRISGRWANSSFAHNPFLMPSVLDPQHWSFAKPPPPSSSSSSSASSLLKLEAPIELDGWWYTQSMLVVRGTVLHRFKKRFQHILEMHGMVFEDRPNGVAHVTVTTNAQPRAEEAHKAVHGRMAHLTATSYLLEKDNIQLLLGVDSPCVGPTHMTLFFTKLVDFTSNAVAAKLVTDAFVQVLHSLVVEQQTGVVAPRWSKVDTMLNAFEVEIDNQRKHEREQHAA